MSLSPTITFRVNLGNIVGNQPASTILDGNETSTEAANLTMARTIYLPGLLLSNYVGTGYVKGGYFHHNDTFTVSGMQAQYLKNTYVTSDLTSVLQIVSQSY